MKKNRTRTSRISILTMAEVLHVLHQFSLHYGPSAFESNGFASIELGRDGMEFLNLTFTLTKPKPLQSKPVAVPTLGAKH